MTLGATSTHALTDWRALTTASLAGLLAVVVLGSARFRPDARRRELAAAPAIPSGDDGRRRWTRRRGHGSAPHELARWCDEMAAAVRAGSTLRAALQDGDAPDGAFADLPHRLRRGVPLADALSIDTGTLDERTVVTVLLAVARHGGEAAQPLDRAAATLRRRIADEAERAVQSSQARLSALVMTCLPPAVLLLLLVTSAPVRTAVATPAGSAVLVAGGGLNLLGWWWMHRIIRSPNGRRR